jgi:hypothetical protein
MFSFRSRTTSVAMIAAVAGAGLLGLIATAAAATATTPACGNGSLAVTHTPTDGATGHSSMVLLFRNVGPHTCSLRGFPGFAALNSSGNVLTQAVRTLHGFAGGASAIRTVSLAPGGFASAIAEWMNFNPVTSGDCRFSTSVAVTPPNTSHSSRLAVPVSLCNLQIHPTVAGAPGFNGFSLAQESWVHGASASSAREGYFWLHAATELGEAGGSYTSEMATLRQLTALPDADLSPTQAAIRLRDVKSLDAFFGTPGLYL